MLLGGPQGKPSQLGTLLPATISSINPAMALVDGALTPMPVLTGHPYFPLPGDRVALTQFGQQWIAQPVDAPVGSYVDDLWHCVGDVGEPTFQNGCTAYPNADTGAVYGDTLRFFRDRAGVVWIEGLVNTAATNMQGKAIFTLPPGYRPAYQMVFVAGSNASVFQIGVDPSGAVYVQNSNATSTSIFISLDAVNFMAEDGPTPPSWVDLTSSLNTGGGWSGGPGTFVSTYTGATGTPYPGARYCIDAAGDVHMSGMVTNSTIGQITTSYLTGLGSTGLAGNIDTDFNENFGIAACAGTSGFCRQDVFSSGAILTAGYGNNTGNSGWISLDSLVWPGGNNVARWMPATLINTWTVYVASPFPTLSMRMNKFGTVYLRGLIKGTAGTLASANPSFSTEKLGSPNIQKLVVCSCSATAAAGANRLDILPGGVQPGTALYTGQAPGSATTSFTSMWGIRWNIKPYHP